MIFFNIKIILFAAIFFSVLSCSNAEKDTEYKKVIRDTVIQQKKVTQKSSDFCSIFIDNGVKNVKKLLDTNTTNNSFIDYKKFINNWDTAHSDIYIVNKSKSQYLKLVILPGFSDKSIGIFEIGKIKGKIPHYIQSNLNEFTSEGGCKIGISKAELLKLTGLKEYNEKTKDNQIEISLFSDLSGCKDFEKYNMPFYYAKYIFENEILVKFEFGFENP